MNHYHCFVINHDPTIRHNRKDFKLIQFNPDKSNVYDPILCGFLAKDLESAQNHVAEAMDFDATAEWRQIRDGAPNSIGLAGKRDTVMARRDYLEVILYNPPIINMSFSLMADLVEMMQKELGDTKKPTGEEIVDLYIDVTYLEIAELVRTLSDRVGAPVVTTMPIG